MKEQEKKSGSNRLSLPYSGGLPRSLPQRGGLWCYHRCLLVLPLGQGVVGGVGGVESSSHAVGRDGADGDGGVLAAGQRRKTALGVETGAVSPGYEKC